MRKAAVNAALPASPPFRYSGCCCRSPKRVSVLLTVNVLPLAGENPVTVAVFPVQLPLDPEQLPVTLPTGCP